MSIESIPINRLANEKSPYLLMHSHNPVDWFPWGEEAFSKARDENKLVIVSIGYAACHWCHVMEHESFSDKEVAKIMNNHFVSIKVDREERPDIDDIYMKAVQLISGQGGWPLNAILLPDGKPVFAITYMPRENWKNLLHQIQQLRETSNEKLVEQAMEITHQIQELNFQYIKQSILTKSNIDTLHAPFQNLIQLIDFKDGGLNSAPKFPMPVVFEYLLHYYHFSRNEKALEAIKITLDKMHMGGIYDQIGGGFARYSTDSYWKVPHFEKMLYDNAQLVSLYANAFKLTQHEPYAQVLKETLSFINREMISPESGFYSAIDADSEGKEGTFYAWDYDALHKILDQDELFILDYYSVEKVGNWEHEKNILFRTQADEDFILAKRLSPEQFQNKLLVIRKKMFNHREKKIRPFIDTKVIASWNALMIKGCLDAYAALGLEQYLTIALNNAQFILEKLLIGSSLYRNYKDGKHYNNAKLDDYANVIQAFISLYYATFDEQWLNHADVLTQHTLQHFQDSQSGMFFYTSNLDEELITRQLEIPDQVIPSSNSVMALNLYYLGVIYEKPDYTRLSEKMVYHIQENITTSTIYFANWAKLQLLMVNKPFEVALVGEKCMDFNRVLNKHFLPNAIITGSKGESNLPLLQHKFIENQTNIHLCKDKVCSLSISNCEDALELLNTKNVTT